MSDIVLHQSSLELAPEAWTLASRIANTEFVPGALRGKPEAVLAAMLTGHELGIQPMQSLAKIHVIDGRPAMAAELMRALILRAGHEIWVEESTPTRCTIVGKRAGSQRESKVTWTMDDAKRAGLDGRQNWRKYPSDMLLARATAKLARSLFADVIAGVSYSVEELTDGEQLDDEPGGSVSPIGGGTEPKGKRRRASKPATAKAAPEPVVEAEVVEAEVVEDELPPLPGEAGYVGEFDSVEVVEGSTAASSTGGEGGGVGPSQPSPSGSSDGGEPTEVGTARSASGDGDVVTPTAQRGEDRHDAASPPSDVSPKAKARATHVAIACREIGIEKDEDRHAFLAVVTDGRASSGKQLDDTDFALVQECIGRVKDGRLRLVHEIDGGLRIEEATAPDVGAASDDEGWWGEEQWVALGRAHGLTKTKCLRLMRNAAVELDVSCPSDLAAITDPTVAARLRELIQAQEAAVR